MGSLRVSIGSVRLDRPGMVASGIMDETGASMVRMLRSGAGAVVSKSVGSVPKPGHPNPNFTETVGGCVNAMGLPNPGIDAFGEEMRTAVAEGLTGEKAWVYARERLVAALKEAGRELGDCAIDTALQTVYDAWKHRGEA